MKEIWRRLQHWLIINVAATVLRMWFATCRIKIIGRPIHDRYIDSDANIVGVTWHRGAIFLVWFFRKVHPMIMFSKSKDGDLIARFAQKLGVVPVRGSSSKGGSRALKTMLEYLNQPGSRKVATVMDGPRGPRCVAKKGMIVLAREAGVPLVPIMASGTPAITLKNTWDKTWIPLPFSKVTVIYEQPWFPANDSSDEALERLRADVETTLNHMMVRADADTGYADPPQPSDAAAT